MLQKYTSVVLLGLLGFAALAWVDKKPSLKPGNWRATIDRPDGQQIVFSFETKDSAGKTILYVINGAERLLVDSILQEKDSIIIQLPFFESGFRAKLSPNGSLQGVWVKNFGPQVQRLPFTAILNGGQRFSTTTRPVANITGRWLSHFIGKNNKTNDIVAEFVQQGARLTGTFLDPTGDYRYLEGVVNGDSLKLSGFDGGHAFLFTAKIENDHTISGGKFYSGAHGLQEWTAEKNDTAAIPDGYDAASKASGQLSFSFPNITDGQKVSLSDKKYANKVVVIQILGSWCPNCMDETQFLSEYYKTHQQKGVEIIGIAYERTTDFEKSRKALQSFKTRFNVQYPVLVPGVAVSDSLRAEKTLPQLGKIDAFPTTIFLDKKGLIKKVHTGYNGPATGVHYEAFKKEFDETIQQLLQDK